MGRISFSAFFSKCWYNLAERMNRYFSMSRRSSLFFGSHSGAERAAVLYTLALPAKINGVNLFEYIVDILDKTFMWQPNTQLSRYRDLLPVDGQKCKQSSLVLLGVTSETLTLHKRQVLNRILRGQEVPRH